MTSTAEANFGRTWRFRLIDSDGEVLNEKILGDSEEAIRWAETLIGGLTGYPIRLERYAENIEHWVKVFEWSRLTT